MQTRLALLAALVPFVAAIAAQWHPAGLLVDEPFEHTVYRDGRTRHCSGQSTRQISRHRGLARAVDNTNGKPPYTVEQQCLVTSADPVAQHTACDERLRITSHDLNAIAAATLALCPHLEQTLHPGDGTQEPFSGLQITGDVPPPKMTLYALSESGNSRNRVDLVFFSDGYTAEEEQKFVRDAKVLAEDISANQTFATVSPLLNFWAAFTPSAESGVGTGGHPKDTVYGLYRDGTELRGVYYSKPEVARAACNSLGRQCDYPILLGNDPFYGGLGGEFTVITASTLNGPLVLRHELGHSIIEIGEEYDGGPEGGYFGCNAALSLDVFPWKHWLSDSSLSSPREEKSAMPFQAYPWTLLTASQPWSTTFYSSGLYTRYVLRFSLSGLPEASDLLVNLDGTDMKWKPRPNIGVDRWHYDIPIPTSLTSGKHVLQFKLRNPDREGLAQLCSAEVIEFGDENEFNSTVGYIGAFPTFSESNETSYRPTNEGCLMRIVTSPDFCPVCLEGLWLSLFRRVDLIDGVTTHCEASSSDESRWTRTINIHLLHLAHLRELDSLGEGEAFEIKWAKNGVPLQHFANATSISLDEADDTVAMYSIEVKFHTPEVRADPDKLLVSAGDFIVARRCVDSP